MASGHEQRQYYIDVNTKDFSHTLQFGHHPHTPQPLLAAAWEQNNYDIVDAIMEFQPDTSIMYSNGQDERPKPLFFQVSQWVDGNSYLGIWLQRLLDPKTTHYTPYDNFRTNKKYSYF